MAAGTVHVLHSEVKARQLHTRLLFPFLVPVGTQAAIRKIMKSQMCAERPLWFLPKHDDSLGAYGLELLPDLNHFLFSNGEHACAFLRIRPEIAQKWFRNSFAVDYQRPESSELPKSFRASVPSGNAIEIFVSPFGAGIMSISIRSTENCEPIGLADLREFNYKVAQLLPNKSSRIQLPCAPGQLPSSDISFPIEERLGRTGAHFCLYELCDYLLRPLAELPVRQLQTQFSIFSVVRCGLDCDLSNEAVRDEIAPFLSGLSQIEECTHAGGGRGVIQVPNELLNRCHWAAVSSLGSAHVVCDQESPYSSGKNLDFNEQRVSVVKDKYFVAYLNAFLQRLALANLVHETESNLRCEDPYGKNAALHLLRRTALQISAQMASYSVSSREAINQYYRLCERGTDLTRALRATKETVDALEQCEQADYQSKTATSTSENIAALTRMQRTVGWLEIFFAAVYGLELFRTFGEGLGYSSHFMNLSAVAWALLCGCMAAAVTQPWKHAKIQRQFLLRAGLFLGIALSIWILLGHYTR